MQQKGIGRRRMKRLDKTHSFAYGYLFLTAALPVFLLVFLLLRCRMTIRFYPLLAATVFLLKLLLGIPLLRKNVSDETQSLDRVFSWTLFVSVINLYIHMLKSRSYVVTAIAVCGLALSALLYCKFSAHKVWPAVLSMLLVLPFAVAGFFTFTVDEVVKTTVVETVISPNGTYRAEIVDSDQGAFGGNTIVNVYEQSAHLDLFLVAFQKEPHCVYMGDWGEFESMNVMWSSDNVLTIDGTAYPIR